VEGVRGGDQEKKGWEVYGRQEQREAGSGRKREKLCNVAQYFAIEKMQRGGSQQIQGGNQDKRVWEARVLNCPVPPPDILGHPRVTPCLTTAIHTPGGREAMGRKVSCVKK